MSAPVTTPTNSPAPAISGIGEMLTRNLRQSGILIAFVVVFVASAIASPNFLSPGNISNIVQQYSYILILAMGMLLVIVAAQIDLSVGSVVALTGAVAAVVVIKWQMPWWVGVLAALLVGVLVGIWHGFWVAFVGIPGFIVTLGGMLIFRGLTFQVLNSVSLSPFGGTYYEINNGFQNGLLGG
jgi:putative multiple sugar transport system permease protein